MIRSRYRKVLLVAPEIYPEQLISNYSSVKHVNTISSIFPSIYESKPDLVIFDFDFMDRDLEKTLRRIQSNKFYNSIKICCFKNKRNEKIDSFLRVLGVDQFIYREELGITSNNANVLNT